MTSEEIKRRYIFQKDTQEYHEKFWLREIAYQLAVANERNKPMTAEEMLILHAGLASETAREDAKAAARRIMIECKQGAALNAVIEDYPEMWAEVQGAKVNPKPSTARQKPYCMDCGAAL